MEVLCQPIVSAGVGLVCGTLVSAVSFTHFPNRSWKQERSSHLTSFEVIMDIRTVGVIGAGTMGNGIAHVFAKNGYNVVLVDVEQRFIDRGLQTIGKNLEREVAKNKLTSEQRALALGRITGTVDRKRLADSDFIVEAASERFEIKADLFRDQIGRAHV